MTPDRDLDHLLDTTLHALATTAPAPGLADRLKTALARHEADPGTLRPSHLRSNWRPAAVVALLCLGCTLALLPHSKRRTERIPSPAQTASPNPSSLSTAPPTAQQVPSQPPNSHPKTEPTPSSLTAQDHVNSQLTTERLPPPTPSTPVRLHLSLDTPAPASAADDLQALADLHTPSYPAPPLPLTEQERAVRLMLRQGERRDLAQLEPGRRDAALQQDRASFTQFFDPPIDPAILNQPRTLADAQPAR